MKPIIHLQQPKRNYKLLTMIAAFLYIVEYHFIYEQFIAVYYSYAKINYSPISSNGYLALILQAFLPIIFFKGIKNISSFYSFFIYIFVYIPFVDALHTCGIPESISFSYGIVFFICMSLLFITDSLYIGKHHINKARKLLPFSFFEASVLVVLIFCIIINLPNMTFVNFLSDSSDLYEKRAAYSSSGSFKIAYYLVLWLAHFLLPFLSVVYITNKKYLKLVAVIVASILVYMINMQKATFIIPILIIIAYYLYLKFQKIFINYVPILVILIIGGVSLLLFHNLSNPVIFEIAAIFIMRTQCIEGMEFDRYIHFFEVANNPKTHYTHINIINKLIDAYPYPESIGRMVAGDGGNSNATFWLMDGVAAEGILGVVLITIIFVITKGYLNSIGLKFNYMIVVFSLLFIFAATANVSFFTVILSDGLLIGILTYYFVNIPLPKNHH